MSGFFYQHSNSIRIRSYYLIYLNNKKITLWHENWTTLIVL